MQDTRRQALEIKPTRRVVEGKEQIFGVESGLTLKINQQK